MPYSARVPREAMVGDPFLGLLAPLAVKAAGAAFGAAQRRLSMRGGGGVPPTSLARAGSGTGHRALPAIPAAPTSRSVQGFVSARSRLVRPRGMRRRRMNTLNLRALKRALRRVKGFEKIARKVVRAPRHFRTKFPARKRAR